MFKKMLVFGQEVARWVYEKTGGTISTTTAGLGWEKDGKLIAGVSIEGWNGVNLFSHQRIDSPPPRKYWWHTADYFFNKLGCNRVTALVPKDNKKAHKINKRIGFIREGVLEKADNDGLDLIVMVLWKKNCKMLEWNHGR